MSVIQIRKAQREGARLIIGLAGVSGSGKTFTAIQLAYGMAKGDGSKVGFLDTENRRGSLYADDKTYSAVQQSLGMAQPPEPFLIGDLYAPFSPERYIQAVQDFQRAGVEVLVIDSATHEYEGTGGLIEMAEAGNPRMPNWNKAKAAHKRFMNAVLQCDMHIIFCVRAREKATPEKVDGKTVFRDLGLCAIQEKNFMFEMTASVMLHDQGSRQDVMKCPAMLQQILGRGQGYITAEDGRAVRDWIDGGVPQDKRLEGFRNRLISNCEKGLAHIKACWGKTPVDVQQQLGEGFLQQIEASAADYDRIAKEEAEGAQAGGQAPGASQANRQGPAQTANALTQAAQRGNQARTQAPAGNAQQGRPAATQAPKGDASQATQADAPPPAENATTF